MCGWIRFIYSNQTIYSVRLNVEADVRWSYISVKPDIKEVYKNIKQYNSALWFFKDITVVFYKNM